MPFKIPNFKVDYSCSDKIREDFLKYTKIFGDDRIGILPSELNETPKCKTIEELANEYSNETFIELKHPSHSGHVLIKTTPNTSGLYEGTIIDPNGNIKDSLLVSKDSKDWELYIPEPESEPKYVELDKLIKDSKIFESSSLFKLIKIKLYNHEGYAIFTAYTRGAGLATYSGMLYNKHGTSIREIRFNGMTKCRLYEEPGRVEGFCYVDSGITSFNAEIKITCDHEWKSTLCIYNTYYDCKKCGVKKEEIE